MSLELIGTALLVAAAPAGLLGPILFGLSGRWWENRFGRALMIAWTGLGGLVLLSTVFLLFGDYWGRPVLRLVFFALLFVGLWYKLIVVVKIWRERPHDRRRATSERG